ESLAKELANGTTTEAFWQEVSKAGTPLVESLGPTAKHQLVTFLWRGTADTRNVLVLWDPYSWVSPQDYVMHRLAETDVWSLTIRVPRGARFIYQLSINDPIDSPGLGMLRLGPAVQVDPLNSN